MMFSIVLLPSLIFFLVNWQLLRRQRELRQRPIWWGWPSGFV